MFDPPPSNDGTASVVRLNDNTMNESSEHAIDEYSEVDDTCSLEDTIDMMETSQLCFHPVHHHSFAQVTFLISGSLRLCAGCDNRMHSVLGYAFDSDSQVVQCMACGVYAHRSCAMSNVSVWKEKCKVNSKIIQKANGGDKGAEENIARSKEASQASGSTFKTPPPTMQHMQQEVTMVWTNDGPPNHWAKKEGIGELIADKIVEDASIPEDEEEKEEVIEDDESDNDEPMQISESTFVSVSRALQENVLIHFRRQDPNKGAPEPGDDDQADDEEMLQGIEPLIGYGKDASERSCKEETLQERKERLGFTATSETSSMPKETRDALLQELKPEVPPAKRSSLMKLASGTYEAAKTSQRLRKKLGVVSVVGGIAGGVAGLAMAGPAGAVLGIRFGQTAGVLSVVIEGSMAVGVLVAGAAAGSFTAQQIQQQAEQRILAIGEDGTQRKVLLVRPHVWIDPVWEEVCEEAKRDCPAVQTPGMLSILTNSPSKQAEIAKKQRYQRDSDIVQTAEFELPTEQKVLLLVSRILNDKLSLPGHVYRALIKEHRRRSSERKLEEMSKAIEEMEADALNGGTSHNMSAAEIAAAPTIRSRRLDTHAVIKHVTATLLEVRPGFASSPTITEMSATAVEGLVFGELYDSVLEELLEESRVVDEALMTKISSFANEHPDMDREDISLKALNTLALIPGAHTPVDKLRYCVSFLEHISEHFSSPNKKALSADSLLKMVCLHLVAANIPYMNAEIAFLEEFARDERLLRGKEGYALVTLQASLHFLNASNNFEQDIFFVDDE